MTDRDAMTDRETALAQALVALADGQEPEIAYTRDGDEWLIVGPVSVQTRTGAQRAADPDAPKGVLTIEIG
jgi:hypothetical protein